LKQWQKKTVGEWMGKRVLYSIFGNEKVETEYPQGQFWIDEGGKALPVSKL
jgi:hypothetical protein